MSLIEMAQKEFLAEKKFEGLTENSLTSYTNFFSTWNQWLATQGIEQVEDLSSRITKQYLHYCMERCLSRKLSYFTSKNSTALRLLTSSQNIRSNKQIFCEEGKVLSVIPIVYLSSS